MKEKEVKIEIEKGIRQGISKSELYSKLKDQYDDDSLRLLLASKPSVKNQKKYKAVHLTLSIIWGIFSAFELLSIIELLDYFDFKLVVSIIISFYLTINIWRFNGKFFLPGIIWFIITIFNAFKQVMDIPEYDPDYYVLQTISLGYIFMLIVGIFLMYYIRKKVFDYYKWFTPDRNYKNERIFQQITAPNN